MRTYVVASVVLLSLALLPVDLFPSVDKIELPKGFMIEEFATGLGSPRFMAFSPDGVLFATIIRTGEVIALPDNDKKGKAHTKVTFLNGLNSPHGIDFYNGYLYIGETNQIARYKYNGVSAKPGKKEVILPNLPSGGHFTRTVGFGPDGKMYVSVGSSCNVCEEKDKKRAAILRLNPDGSDLEVFASGLRNAVGLTWDPVRGEMWATDNGRDWLGDNLPPDEINIVKEGQDYGWPYCYGNKIPDPEFNDRVRCLKTVAPIVELQAHSAPLGLTFYDGDQYPEDYKGDLFVAYHGSWNRSIPTGYKLVRIRIEDGEPQGIEDFATGWLQGTEVLGRPVGMVVGPDGSLYVSSDRSGIIYKITYTGRSGR